MQPSQRIRFFFIKCYLSLFLCKKDCCYAIVSCLFCFLHPFIVLAQEPFSWSVTGGYEYSTFSRREQQDWQSAYEQLDYTIKPGLIIHARTEETRRFALYDQYSEAGIDQQFTKRLAGYLYAGATPEADFLPKQKLAAGGTWVATRHANSLVFTVDTRYDAYNETTVYTLNPGIQYYIGADSWLTARLITVTEEGSHFSSGWLGRFDRQITPGLRLYGLLADAPETVAGETVTTVSLVGGIAYNTRNNSELHLDYTHDDREHSYIRNAVNVAARIRF